LNQVFVKNFYTIPTLFMTMINSPAAIPAHGPCRIPNFQVWSGNAASYEFL
jgi:hypothetical protein